MIKRTAVEPTSHLQITVLFTLNLHLKNTNEACNTVGRSVLAQLEITTDSIFITSCVL